MLFLCFCHASQVLLRPGLAVILYAIEAIYDNVISFQFVLTCILGYVAGFCIPSVWAFMSYQQRLIELGENVKRLYNEIIPCKPQFCEAVNFRYSWSFMCLGLPTAVFDFTYPWFLHTLRSNVTSNPILKKFELKKVYFCPFFLLNLIMFWTSRLKVVCERLKIYS